MQAVDFTASPYDHLQRDEVDDVATGHSPRHAPLSDLEESESQLGCSPKTASSSSREIERPGLSTSSTQGAGAHATFNPGV